MNIHGIKQTIILIMLMVLGSTASWATEVPVFSTVSGIVKDRKTNKKLENVSITAPGTNIGTVTNADGYFTLKLSDSLQVTTVEISHVGYFNQVLPVNGKSENLVISLIPYVNALPEVVIRSVNPKTLVENAIRKIADNYSDTPNLYTGFYRETIKKRRNYINVTEAVINIYKSPYTEDVSRDRVQIYKGRQLLSPKRGDTLAIKLQGGPNFSIYLDIVKNRDLMLQTQDLFYYDFKMEQPVTIGENVNYVVSFKPRVSLPYALLYGRLYIDEKSLAFTRAEFWLSMDDRNKATEAILRRKPFKLRFKPEEVAYLVTYKEKDGRTYLNYMRNEIRFRCDWKRKLFSTGYEVVSEMVVTDRKEEKANVIPLKHAFKQKSILSDEVGSFYDENFWEDYNILEPTESLEAAVNKLKKQYK